MKDETYGTYDVTMSKKKVIATMNIINATNVTQCLELLLKLANCKWYQFRKRAILKNRIENQFLNPMQSDQRKIKPDLNETEK